MGRILLYTDGACRGNQFDNNIGAWAFKLLFENKDGSLHNYTKEGSGTAKDTTNNKMELTAVIEGLKAIKDKQSHPIVVYSDSDYVVSGATVWYKGWEQKGWKKVKNPDLWQELLKLVRECKDVIFEHVPGHSGVELNELVDKLCNKCMDNARSYVE